MPVRVKVCGVTRLEDADAAVRCGASAIGFVFWPRSPRLVAEAVAASIAASLPAFVARVGVFVDESPAEMSRLVREIGLDVVQLHGDEDVAACAAIPARLIKAVTLQSAGDVARAEALPAHVTVLVDAADPVRRGGTGTTGNWELAAALAARRPILLAGGLSDQNVAAAVRAVRPWGIDVSSGVEVTPGVKSAERIGRLFAALAAA